MESPVGYRKVLVLEPDEDETARRICLCLAQATAVGLRKLGLSATGGMTGNFVVISIDEVDVTHVDGIWVYGPQESVQRFRDTVKSLAIQVLDAVQTSMSARGYPDWPRNAFEPRAQDTGGSLIGGYGPWSYDPVAPFDPKSAVVVIELDWAQLVLQATRT